MLSKEQIERYKKMSSQEKWELTCAAIEDAWNFLMSLPAEERQKRLEAIRKLHDDSSDALLAGLLKADAQSSKSGTRKIDRSS